MTVKRPRISIRQFMEDAIPTNNVGSGHVAGLGVGPQGEPGGSKFILFKRKKKTLSRNKEGL